MNSLKLTGWRTGIQSVSLIRAIREYSTVASLAQAKELLESLLEGKVVTLEFHNESDRDQFRSVAQELGADAE